VDGVTRILVALLVLAGAGTLPSIASAECVSLSRTLEQTFKGEKLVFLADVMAIDAVIDPEPFRWRVRFQVVEAFKGTEPGERVFYFRTTPDDFKFTGGTHVLVYAGGLDDRLSTSCTQTRVVGDNDREVQELRKLSAVGDKSGAQRP
jgi:hypothetical protein